MITATVDRHDGRVRLSWYDASWRVCQTTLTSGQAHNICEALTSLARSAARGVTIRPIDRHNHRVDARAHALADRVARLNPGLAGRAYQAALLVSLGDVELRHAPDHLASVSDPTVPGECYCVAFAGDVLTCTCDEYLAGHAPPDRTGNSRCVHQIAGLMAHEIHHNNENRP